MQRFVLILSLAMISTPVLAQMSGPSISLDGRILLAQNQQAPDAGYYRPVPPQGRQAPCGGFGTPPCTGKMIQDTGPSAEQLFDAARMAAAQHHPSESLDYLTRSAEMGYRKAEYALGTEYQEGIVVGKDMQKAKYWLDRAAQQGSVAAETSLKQMDPAQATHYLEMGAAQRDSQADFDLGLNYELGHGVPHDRAKAMQYLRKASIDGGNPTGEQIAAALSRTSPGRRFQSKAALMALAPAPAQNVATRRQTGCPAWYDSTFTGTNSQYLNISRSFCIVHPNCSFSMDNQTLTCNGDETPLHYK